MLSLRDISDYYDLSEQEAAFLSILHDSASKGASADVAGMQKMCAIQKLVGNCQYRQPDKASDNHQVQ